MITLHAGDNRATLRRLINEGVKVHSIVTDPPYGLTSITKRFGKEGSAPARSEKNDGSFARLSGGFMNKAWDGTGIERDPEFWRLIWEILLPGGYVFAFSGSRTGHWQAVAMEQAGFIMHPMHGWVFGSGFPKAHNAGNAIDKHLGKGKAKIGSGDRDAESASGDYGLKNRCQQCGKPFFSSNACECPKPRPVTDEGLQWEGWAYGTQTQKPALEPIYLGQKPFSEKTGAANILKHGVGAVNIDGCRVPTEDNLNGGAYAENPTEREAMWGEEAGNSWRRGGAGEFKQPAGRHPANLMHDGSAEVIELFPNGNGRFFNCFPQDIDPIFYNTKAGKEDRAGGKHPTVKPVALMRHLVRHITPPGGVVLDPFAGSGTTAEAAKQEGFDCILMEAEPEYVEFLKLRFKIEEAEDFDLLADVKKPETRRVYVTDPLQELLG